MLETTEHHRLGREEESRHGEFRVVFPDVNRETMPQDEEYCLVEVDGLLKRIRFHDYHDIYEVPGLYEHIFYEKLACQSPALLGTLLQYEVRRTPDLNMDELIVLDVGAGNGIMGETVMELGADAVVGVDILREAAVAAERDRPGLYDAYHAVDLLNLPRPVHLALKARHFNCLTMVAALGFGDIPPEAFAVAYNYLESGGLVAFNLRDQFLEGGDESGFAGLVRQMLERDWLEEQFRVRYVHRLSITGEPLIYNAIIGRKRADIPATLIPVAGPN